MTLRELINLVKFDVDQASLQKTEKQIDSTIRNLDKFGKRASLLLTTPILALTGLSIRAAGNVEATTRRFNVLFAGVSDKAMTFVKDFSDQLLYGESTVQQTLSDFQALFTGMNMTGEGALDLSIRMQRVLADFVSFNGISQETGKAAFISGLTGMTRTLKQYGIVLNESTSGLSKNATEAEKVKWRVEQIEAALKRQGAIGAIRNLASFTDGMRIFREQIGDVAEEFGLVLLPAVSKILTFINDRVIWIKNLNSSVKITIMVFTGLLAIIGPLTMGLAGLLTVAKALVIWKTWIGGLAGLKAAGLMLLHPHFLAIAAVILVAVAALALFIEDVTVWVQGGDSLTGRLLGPWKKWKEGLKEAFKTATTDFDFFVKAMGIALVDGLTDAFGKVQRFVTRINDYLDKSKVGKFLKFFIPLWGATEFTATTLGTIHGTLQTKSISGTASDAFSSAAGTGNVANNFNVQNAITLQVPAGTSAEQADFLKTAADKAFKFGMSAELQQLLENEGGR